MAYTVLVTGGSGGLGGAVVRRLAVDGWRVVAPDVSAPRSPVEGVEYVSADLFDPAAVAAAVDAAAGDPDRPLRAVVNLVGGYAAGGLVHETPVDDFEAQLRLNLRPTYLVCHYALPRLVDAGGGAVVCVSSRAAVRPFAGAAGYVTAKAAVLALVDALAVEYRNHGVRANAVLPSVIDTPANRAAQPQAAFDTWVKPEQIAGVVAFLCSDASAVTSGAHIPVYGSA
ncbi:MAG TPA: SDR family oxidoreductase [Micromonosporaceae bacterium]|nr:SDR family oxidoreductase [Micromonosporaceae bacterium]